MLPQWRCKELRVVDLGDRGSTVFGMLEPHDQVRVMGMSPCTHTRSGEESCGVEEKKPRAKVRFVEIQSYRRVGGERNPRFEKL